MLRKILPVIIFAVAVSIFSLYSQSIRLDESQSIWVSTKSIREILFLQSQDVNPPFYNLLLHFWTQIFGIDIMITRTLSLIFFLLTLFAIYALAKEEAKDDGIAFLTVLLFALSPFVLWFSNETRTYTLFTLITTLNNIFYLRTLRSQFVEGKLSYVMTAIAGVFTHYFFFFVLLTQLIYRRSRKLLALMVLVSLAFAPWAFYVVKSGLAAATQPIIPSPTTFTVFQTLVSFLFGFQNPTVTGILISLWPLIVVFLLLVFTNRPADGAKNINYFILLSFLPILLTFLISFVRPIFIARYLVFVLPSLFFILAWTIENLSKGLSRLFSVGILVIMVGLLLVQNFSASTPVKEDYKEVSSYLTRTTTPSDIIAVSAPFTIYPLEYSYSGHTRIDTIPQWDRYSTGPTPAFTLEGLQSQLADYQTVYNRLFVVLSYDQGYEARIRNYLDTHYHLLDSRQFPSGIDLRVYKLRYS